MIDARARALAGALALLCLAWAGAARAELDAAQKALHTGSYDQVEELLGEDRSPAARLVRAHLWLETGRYDEAAQLAAELSKGKGEPATRARLLGARAHARRGRHDAARRMLEPLVREGHPAALARLARSAEAAGDHAAARRAHRALIEAYNAGRIADDDSRGLLGVALSAWRLGAFKDANTAFAEASRADPEDVEVQLAWADLFLSKYAAAQAHSSLEHALGVNANHPGALQRMAQLQFEHRLDFAKATELLDRALDVDPKLVAAHVTRGAIALRDHALDDVQAAVDAALAVDPKDLEALSLAAALAFVTDDAKAFRRAERAVLRVDPRFSRLYHIIARYAEWEHRYGELVELAGKALRIDPDDALAHADRGLNLLRVGREKQGLAALREAWRRDRYNERVFNTLNLYDDVIAEQYVTFQDGRYTLRTHEDERAVLEPYLAPLLQRGFASLSGRYGIAPGGPLWFELYARPDHFSVRTTGMPHIGVQGVCFGKVVTALSPAAGPINWGQILWHEQAHIFHIALSKNRVPRWFTEGLAEYETEIARPEWGREDDLLLLSALEDEEVPALSRLNHAFTHAKGPAQMMVAYYASSRVVAYIVDRFGFEVVPRMLRAWGEGLDTAAVVQRTLKLSLDTLDAEFRAHELKRLDGLREQFFVDLERSGTPGEWRKAVARSPSAENHAGLAVALLARGALEPAIASAVRATKRDPENRQALWVLAEASFRKGDMTEAQRALDALHAAGARGYPLSLLRARIAIKAGDWARAKKELLEAVELRDDDGEVYVALGVVAQKSGDLELWAEASMALARIDQHEPGPTLTALPLLADLDRWKDVRSLAEAGVYVAPGSSILHRFWARAVLETEGAKAAGRARELAERGVQLADAPEAKALALIERARAETRAGQLEQARETAARARELAPAFAEAAEKALSR